MKTKTKFITGTIIPILFGVNNLSADLKTNLAISTAKNEVRAEFFYPKKVQNLNCSLFNVNEQNYKTNNTFHRLKGECNLPINKNIEIGVHSSYYDSNNFTGYIDQGISTVIKLKLDKSYSSAGIRYSSSKDILDSYGFYNGEKLFVDYLVVYNLEKKSGFIRPAIEYKFSNNFKAGIEGFLPIENKKLKNYSIGLRGSFNF